MQQEEIQKIEKSIDRWWDAVESDDFVEPEITMEIVQYASQLLAEVKRLKSQQTASIEKQADNLLKPPTPCEREIGDKVLQWNRIYQNLKQAEEDLQQHELAIQSEVSSYLLSLDENTRGLWLDFIPPSPLKVQLHLDVFQKKEES